MMYDILIVGAGPTGLACAIEAQKAGLSYLVVEKGSLTETVRRYPRNMTFFSTPELLTLDDIPFSTVNVRPTRREALQYYRGVAAYHKLNIRLHTRACRVRKESNDIFCLDVASGLHSVATQSQETGQEKLFARFVVIATGYFDYTNRLNIPGEDLPHVSHYYDEPYRYTMTDVVVVGGRNSAAEAALDLWRHGARVTLVHRADALSSAVKYWVRPDIENRLKNGEIASYFHATLKEIRPGSVRIANSRTGEEREIAADFVLPLIGYRPDEALLRSAGIELNDELIPYYHAETFESNVPGLYLAGSVVCGCQTWTIFIENGRLHAQPIMRSIRQRLRR